MIQLGERLGTGNTGDVYTLEGSPDRVIKLITKESHSARKEFNVNRIVGGLGCGAPQAHRMVRIGELDGIEYDRVEGTPWLKTLIKEPAIAPEMAAAMARAHARIHAASPDGLSPKYESNRLNVLCHGDFHPGNIMAELDDPVVIDWNDAYAGDPASDVCRTLLLLACAGYSADIKGSLEDMPCRIFGFGALYLKEYLRITGMSAEDVFKWQRTLAEQRMRESIPGQEKFLQRVAQGGHMFPWNLQIKRKPFLWGTTWPSIKKARFSQRRIELPEFTGWAGLMYADEVSHKSVFESPKTVAIDTGFRWLHLLPDKGGCVMTAFIDRDGFINLWYIDLISGYGQNADGSLWFDDLLLDIMLSPDGRRIIGDRDELEAAYAIGVVSEAQYRAALAEAKSLLCEELADPKRLDALCIRIATMIQTDS